MIHVIIGHRGVGKSSFLKRIRAYYQNSNLNVTTKDLDEEITTRTNRSVADIFKEDGEPSFRAIEIQIFNEILCELATATETVYIAVGAGFKGDFPSYVKVLWLRRPTDGRGRIFLDRPRLDTQVSPLEEYLDRFDIRETVYRKAYTKEISIGEGFSGPTKMEEALLGLYPPTVEASMTVLPEHMQNEFRLEDFLAEKLHWGIRFFELRNDLLTQDQIKRLLIEIPKEKALISLRIKPPQGINLSWMLGNSIDWAMELGDCSLKKPEVLSLHQRLPDETVEEAAERLLTQKAGHYKLAIEIKSPMELWAGHVWRMEDPENRSFLPMSREGRWAWYRLLQGPTMRINFVREGKGSSVDQPTVFEWLSFKESRQGQPWASTHFAAIIGDPIIHSRTPAEHFDFFKKRNRPILSVSLKEEEMNSLNLGVLGRLGLDAMAVTSPLKANAAKVINASASKKSATKISTDKAINTLLWDHQDNEWKGINTDLIGLESVLSDFAFPKEVAVWGGGGTLEVLRTLFPQAQFFSARTGELRDAKRESSEAPRLVVWAVGRERMKHSKYPPRDWKPLMVLDLNYSEDSPGREYALNVGARYHSGLEMFKAQAKAQRKFWGQFIKEEPLFDHAQNKTIRTY